MRIPEGRGARQWQKRSRLFVASFKVQKEDDVEWLDAPADGGDALLTAALTKRIPLLKTSEERYVLGIVLEPGERAFICSCSFGGIGRHAHSFWCSRCHAMRSSTVGVFGIGWRLCHPALIVTTPPAPGERHRRSVGPRPARCR